MYIYRELLGLLKSRLSHDQPKGVILTGVVGCGKTTLVEKLIGDLSSEFDVFSFSGDDSHFRQSVADDSKFLLEKIRSRSNRRSLIFVDEVQKTEEVFDALKIVFDQGKVSFIVSGSNPAYLSTIAKKRLQRRAEQIFMLPIALSELLCHQGQINDNYMAQFQQVLWDYIDPQKIPLPAVKVPNDFTAMTESFFTFGGLPLALKAADRIEKLREISLTLERGFELMSTENNAIADKVRSELARLHSREFTYKNILERTRLRRRDAINQIIDDLINHGYLVKKKPMIVGTSKESYLSIFSYIDAGMVSYLAPEATSENLGFQIEGYVHARLDYHVRNSSYKSELGYFKPFVIDSTNSLRFQDGEIDFILRYGKRLIPIEVKATAEIQNVDTNILTNFLSKYPSAPYAVVLYGGAPYLRRSERILFWPYWMI